MQIESLMQNWVERTLEEKLIQGLKSMPVVVILGPRQVGKTTLALELAKSTLKKSAHYLDMELDSDLAKLDDAESYLRRFENQLLVIDEIQRRPELFKTFSINLLPNGFPAITVPATKAKLIDFGGAKRGSLGG